MAAPVCNLNPTLSWIYAIAGVVLLGYGIVAVRLLPWLATALLVAAGVVLIVEGVFHH